MRELADSARIEQFMRELGRAVRVDGRVYLTGGATAVLYGIRKEGKLSFHHFDPVAQALSKVERGHDQDIQDIREMIATGLVNPAEALTQFKAIEPALYRFPAIDPVSFRKSVADLFAD